MRKVVWHLQITSTYVLHGAFAQAWVVMSDANLPTLAYNEYHTRVRLSFLTHVEKNTPPYVVVVQFSRRGGQYNLTDDGHHSACQDPDSDSESSEPISMCR
jgi:hypothetical protein